MAKINPVLGKCPVCQEELYVTKLNCHHCHTSIEGSFHLSKFNYLDQEQLYFIEIFIKNKGNIKAVEKELNISYPTVKKLLDETIVSLGYEPKEGEDTTPLPQSNSDILDALARGDINVDTALKTIKDRKGGN